MSNICDICIVGDESIAIYNRQSASPNKSLKKTEDTKDSIVYKLCEKSEDFVKLKKTHLSNSINKNLDLVHKMFNGIFVNKVQSYRIYKITLNNQMFSDRVDSSNFERIKIFSEKMKAIAFIYSSSHQEFDRAYIFRDEKLLCSNDKDYLKIRKQFMKNASEYKMISPDKSLDVINQVFNPDKLNDVKIILKDGIVITKN